MSRSRKKRPSYSDYSRSYTKWAKRQASKAVRRYQGELTSGSLYKKVFPSWDIFDYKGVYWQNWFPNNEMWQHMIKKGYRK